MNKFTTISTKDYIPLSHKEEYFHNRYERIQSFMEKEFGEEFASILALPQIKNREVDWHSKYKTRLKRVTEFSKAEQEQILNIYWEKINTIKNLSSSFQNSNSDEKKRWSNLLDDVFNSNNNIVFSDGKNIVLLWGWKFNASEENYIPPPIISTAEKVEDHTISESIEDNNPIPVIPPDPIDDDPIVPKIPWYILLWEWIKKFFRRFWWILLLLLILWLLLNLDRCSYNQPKNHVEDDPYTEKDDPRNDKKNDDQEYVNEDGKNYIIIDDEEIIEGKPPPIQDPEEIIIDEEEGDYERIIPDKINIAIKRNSQEQSILDLIDNFRTEYPELRLEFYRKEAKFMQIQVPPEERVKLKKEIKEKFKGLNYDLLIWDEVIFSSYKYDQYNDPVFENANKRWHFDKINMEDAWKITKGEEDIIIAIVDDGFDINHEDLKDNYYKPYNVYTQDADLTAPWVKKINGKEEEFGFHGTHVAGIAAAKINNNIGTAGIAPNCKLMPIQAGDPATGIFTYTAVIEGILYAINNDADVINLSLGMEFPEEVEEMSESQQKELIENISKDAEEFWIEIFEMANNQNITIVLASGNQNILTGIDAMARSEFTINVASVDDKLRKSDFSNYSEIRTIVSAPGGSGDGIKENDIYSSYPNNQYAFMPGTSMAAPIISGVVALMKSVNPDLTNKEIKDILRDTGYPKYPSIGPLVQVYKALKSCGGTENPENNNEEERRRIEKEIKKKRDEIKELEEKLEDL